MSGFHRIVRKNFFAIEYAMISNEAFRYPVRRSLFWSARYVARRDLKDKIAWDTWRYAHFRAMKRTVVYTKDGQ